MLDSSLRCFGLFMLSIPSLFTMVYFQYFSHMQIYMLKKTFRAERATIENPIEPSDKVMKNILHYSSFSAGCNEKITIF